VRIAVHDHSGHAFQAALSRELARRGHDVLHVHNAAFVTGKGRVDRQADDPATFTAEAISLGEDFPKYSPVARVRHEHQYAGRLVDRLRRFEPDVVLSSNTPLVAQRRLWSAFSRGRVARVFWVQDFYSVAMTQELRRRFGRAGVMAGAPLRMLEARLVRDSDRVVAISEDFDPTLRAWRVPPDRARVIENWAPVEELPVRPRDNPWARAHDLVGKRVLLYAGTLGLKHDPGLLLELAAAMQGEEDVRIVVISQGPGREWLDERRNEARNLVLMDYQPYEALPDVLASGDVLVTLLEPGAGQFSVPSKILSNLCAGRPQLAAVPAENLGARTVSRSGGGIVVDPGDRRAFVDAARRLLGDDEQRRRLGEQARRFAEDRFPIKRVATQFEEVLRAAVTRRGVSAPR
jgi:colanic acid biosynthesis glycosyl transferase WcaI